MSCGPDQPDGGFYSAEDADSEGREGAFYVWRASEIRSALPKEEAEVLSTHFGVSDHGNFEGDNILHVSYDMTRADRRRASAIRTRLRFFSMAKRSC